MHKHTTEVSKKQTIPDNIFKILLRNAECDTLSDLDCVGFSVRYLDNGEVNYYVMNFYGYRDNDYKLETDRHGNYVKIYKTFGLPVLQKLSFTKHQEAQMQALISKEVLEIEKELNDAKTEDLKGYFGYTLQHYRNGTQEDMFI